MTNLPVYNLTTLSGTYFAQGYLVHNCGTPVIVTDFSSMPELCGGGWLVSPARRKWTPINAFQVEPSISGILEALRQAYVYRDDPRLRADALELAARYDQRKVGADHWAPFLERLEARLMGPARGGIRDARELAKAGTA